MYGIIWAKFLDLDGVKYSCKDAQWPGQSSPLLSFQEILGFKIKHLVLKLKALHPNHKILGQPEDDLFSSAD